MYEMETALQSPNPGVFTVHLSLEVCEHKQWRLNSESKLVHWFVFGSTIGEKAVCIHLLGWTNQDRAMGTAQRLFEIDCSLMGVTARRGPGLERVHNTS